MSRPPSSTANTVLNVAAYGVRVRIATNSLALLDALQPHLPLGWQPSTSRRPQRRYTCLETGDGYALYADDQELIQSTRLSEILRVFETDTRLFVAEMTHQRVFLHAGVVGWREQAIVIPGRTYTGKTSLVVALVQAGATYFSDEYAVLDGNGLVYPYPKPLSIRDPITDEQKDHSVETLGGRAATQPLPIGLVVVSQYEVGAVWQPAQLSRGEGVLALADNSISIRRSPQQALAAITRAVANATILSGARGDTAQVVAYLTQHLPG